MPYIGSRLEVRNANTDAAQQWDAVGIGDYARRVGVAFGSVLLTGYRDGTICELQCHVKVLG